MSPLSAHTFSSTRRITDGEGRGGDTGKGYLQTVRMELRYKLWTWVKVNHITESANVFSGVLVPSASGFQNEENMHHMYLVTISR